MLSDRFLMQFHPDQWTAPGKFLQFIGPPYVPSRALNEAVQSCADHIRKYETFAELAAELAPKLALDRDELENAGFSAASRSRQFAALVEVLVCELYSVLDGVRYTTFSLYRKVRGVQSASTSKLFSKAAEGLYGKELPDELQHILAAVGNSAWFPELRRLRTAFTHGGLGSCMLDRERIRISYMNPSLGNGAVAHVIPDITAHLNSLAVEVFAFVAQYFDFHYSRLEQVESDRFCGFYKGRGYLRKVRPEPELNWRSGRCASREWFDSEPDFRCPLAAECPAYARAAA